MALDEFDMIPKFFPAPPFILTLAGILPFLGTTLAMWLWQDQIGLLLTAGLWLLVYATMILSFLGGVRWGVEISRSEPPRWGQLSVSVLGALCGWALVMAAFNPVLKPWMLVVLSALIVLQYFYDRFAPDLPDWYRALRFWPTLSAALCLLAGAALLSRI